MNVRFRGAFIKEIQAPLILPQQTSENRPFNTAKRKATNQSASSVSSPILWYSEGASPRNGITLPCPLPKASERSTGCGRRRTRCIPSFTKTETRSESRSSRTSFPLNISSSSRGASMSTTRAPSSPCTRRGRAALGSGSGSGRWRCILGTRGPVSLIISHNLVRPVILFPRGTGADTRVHMQTKARQGTARG